MKYFFDLGSHLFESTKLFASTTPNANDFDVFCFEAAYDGDIRLRINQELSMFNTNCPFKSFNFFPVAVSTKSGIAEFKRDLSYGCSEASTLRHEKKLARFSAILVPTIDFSALLRATVTENDTCILKIDIEGSEYELIDHMQANGTLGLVTELYIELHEHKIGKNIDKDLTLLDSLKAADITPRSWDAAGYFNSGQVNSNLDHCVIIDEHYIRNLKGYASLEPPIVIFF